jgi:hypothetical protein
MPARNLHVIENVEPLGERCCSTHRKPMCDACMGEWLAATLKRRMLTPDRRAEKVTSHAAQLRQIMNEQQCGAHKKMRCCAPEKA